MLVNFANFFFTLIEAICAVPAVFDNKHHWFKSWASFINLHLLLRTWLALWQGNVRKISNYRFVFLRHSNRVILESLFISPVLFEVAISCKNWRIDLVFTCTFFGFWRTFIIFKKGKIMNFLALSGLRSFSTFFSDFLSFSRIESLLRQVYL